MWVWGCWGLCACFRLVFGVGFWFFLWGVGFTLCLLFWGLGCFLFILDLCFCYVGCWVWGLGFCGLWDLVFVVFVMFVYLLGVVAYQLDSCLLFLLVWFYLG